MISWAQTRASQVHVTSSRSESTADSHSSVCTYGYNYQTTEAGGAPRTNGYSYTERESASEEKSWSRSMIEDIGRRSYTPVNGGAAWPHRQISYTGSSSRTVHREGTTLYSHSYLYGTGNDYTSSQRVESRSSYDEERRVSFNWEGSTTWYTYTISSYGSEQTGDTYKYNSSDTSYQTLNTTHTWTYSTTDSYSASASNQYTYLGPSGPARVPVGTVVDGTEEVKRTVTTQTESFADYVEWNSNDKTTAWANKSFLVDTTTTVMSQRDRTVLQTGFIQWGEGWDSVYLADGTRTEGTSTILLGESTEVLYRVTAEGEVTGYAKALGETFTKATLAATYTQPAAFAGVGVAVVNKAIENIPREVDSFDYVESVTALTYKTTETRTFPHGVPEVGEAPSFTDQTIDKGMTEGSRTTQASYDHTVLVAGETYIDEASLAAGAAVASVVVSTYRALRQGQSETVIGVRCLNQYGTADIATGLRQDYTRSQNIVEMLNGVVMTVGRQEWTYHVDHDVEVGGCATPRHIGVYEMPSDPITWVAKKKAPGILSPDGALVCANMAVVAPLKPRAESVLTAYPGMLEGEGAAVWVSYESTRSSKNGDAATTCRTGTAGVSWTARTSASDMISETTGSAPWIRTDYPSANWSHWETQNFHHGYRPGSEGATMRAAVDSVVDGEDAPATRGSYRFTEQSVSSAQQSVRVGGWVVSESTQSPGQGIAYDKLPVFGVTYRAENDALFAPVISLPKWPGT